ncbi:MAG: DUF799 family lipoprotein [Bacteroidales bacterium]|nr:DUF799 family lipoprotein [Bacteroidales bacterium]
MKKILFCIGIFSLLFTSCSTTSKIPKSTAYKGMYNEKPVSVLLMPPINRSTNVEAKEYFHSTLNVPIANAGFYVIPPFLSMEILKKESAYDSEMFLDSSLKKFGEIFGADMVVFTVIHKWDKSALVAKVFIELEYIVKSTKTNEVLYSRRGNVTYDASVSTSGGGIAGLVASVALSAINTAATKYVDVARACNAYTFKDLPAGKYSPSYLIDDVQMSGENNFNVRLNSTYH